MNNIKKVAIVLLAVVVFALVSSSFVGSDILGRAIIIGVGIDACEQGVLLTAEVISPGNGSEQVGTFSKTISIQGKSVGDAIQRLAAKTGKEASLGQCVLLVLGEEYYQNRNFADTIKYFVESDSFKESAIVCCSSGSAQQVFNRSDALGQSVSLSLEASLIDQAEQAGIEHNNLLEFARSQRELHQTGFLNQVVFEQSNNSNTQDPSKPQGYFSYRQSAIFRNHSYVCLLTEEETTGFGLLTKKVAGNAFVARTDNEQLTMVLDGKDVSKKRKDGGVAIDLELHVKIARNDSSYTGGFFTAKNLKEIPDQAMAEVVNQAKMLAQAFLDRQTKDNFDLLGFHELYRQKQGSSNQLANKPMAEFPVWLNVTGKEM